MANQKKLQEAFIQKARIIHNDKYDYSEVIYHNRNSYIVIKCNTCGLVFSQRAGKHLIGRGCRKCARNLPRDTNSFIIAAKEVHGDKYNYSEVDYKNANTTIIIKCNTCFVKFDRTPSRHLVGYGCKLCSNTARSMGISKFIEKAKTIHGDRYDYSESIYIRCGIKIKIFCNRCHGYFIQEPRVHLSGKGCFACGLSNTISRVETKWLDSLNIPLELRNYKIKQSGESFNVDGFDPETNTVYEFYGDYWHGNPQKFAPNEINPSNKKSFGQLHRATILKEEKLKQLGFKIISMWEYDFVNE